MPDLPIVLAVCNYEKLDCLNANFDNIIEYYLKIHLKQ